MTGAARPISKEHVPALDGIRGIAILLVMVHHLWGYLPLSRAWEPLFEFGTSGVDLFFGLSGFLITGILLDTRGSATYFRSFYTRRILRIFPLYYAALGLLFLYAEKFNSFGRAAFPPLVDWRLYFLYVNNWTFLLSKQMGGNVIGHFWSLAVEEQFYLLWPLAVWILPVRKIPAVAVAGVAGAFLLRVVLLMPHGPTLDVYQNTFCRMDNLLLGALAACAVRSPLMLQRIRPFVKPVAIFAACMIVLSGLMLASSPSSPSLDWSVGFTCRGLLSCGLLLWAFETRHASNVLQASLRWPGLRIAGKYSYGLYVIHVPVYYFVRVFVPPAIHPVLFCLVAFWFTGACTAVSFICIERPFLNWKNGVSRWLDRPMLPVQPCSQEQAS